MFAYRKLRPIVERRRSRPMFERFTPRARQVMVLAQEEARHFNHNYIGTEHILLGLVRESEGLANQVLSNLGVEGDEVRAQLARMLGDEAGRRLEDESRGDGPPEVARNQMLFRGRVASLQISARVDDQAQTLLVDLDYAYAVRDSGGASEAMEHDALLDGVVAYLEGRRIGSVEAGISEAGELVLHRFPAVREITISATRERQLEGGAASSITVTRTFRR